MVSPAVQDWEARGHRITVDGLAGLRDRRAGDRGRSPATRCSCCTGSRRAPSTGRRSIEPAPRRRAARGAVRLPRLRALRQARRPLQHPGVRGHDRGGRGARPGSSGSCSRRTTSATRSAASCSRRALEGTLGFEVTNRIITNGSIYMDLVQLTAGQEMLLAADDARFDLAALGIDPAVGFKGGVAGTFARPDAVDDDELRRSGSWRRTRTATSCCRGRSATSRTGERGAALHRRRSRSTRRRCTSSGASSTRSPATRWPSASRAPPRRHVRDPRRTSATTRWSRPPTASAAAMLAALDDSLAASAVAADETVSGGAGTRRCRGRGRGRGPGSVPNLPVAA